MVEYAKRLDRMPHYIFAELDKLKQEQMKKGTKMISLAIGDPDVPTPKFILDALAKEAADPKNHNYPSYQGEGFFRKAVSRFVKKRFGSDVNSENEALATIGAKEAIANIGRAFVDANDVVLCPDPGYPVYANGTTILSDGVAVKMPLLEENGFLPDFDAIKKRDAEKAKLMFLNYPNNPTGVVCDKKFLEEALEFVREHGIILAYDNAYSEFTFGDYVAPSILEVADIKKDAVIEFHSLSKTFCMTGDRIGFAVGNGKIVKGLGKAKENIDSGVPVYIQKTGAVALGSYKDAKKPKEVREIFEEYAKRRDVLVNGLNNIGLHANKPKGTFYVWVNIKDTGMKPMEFAMKALERGVVLTPGTAFGEFGDGYVRIAVTQPIEKIKEAVERIGKVCKM